MIHVTIGPTRESGERARSSCNRSSHLVVGWYMNAQQQRTLAALSIWIASTGIILLAAALFSLSPLIVFVLVLANLLINAGVRRRVQPR